MLHIPTAAGECMPVLLKRCSNKYLLCYADALSSPVKILASQHSLNLWWLQQELISVSNSATNYMTT